MFRRIGRRSGKNNKDTQTDKLKRKKLENALIDKKKGKIGKS